VIELAILGLLVGEELHGYELRKRLGELLGSRVAVSFGSLYPALNRLEKAGHVKAVTGRDLVEAPLAPMSGSLTGELAALRARRRAASAAATGARGGRGKKVYGVTDAGRRRLHELIVDEDVADDRTFAVRVAFCQHVARPERIALFERRRAELTTRRDQRRRDARATARLDTYLRSLLERDTAALGADIAWLDGLIADERQADTAAGAPTGAVGADTDTHTDSAVGT
jgi:DNA-binding PadR family transcriptional regulator